MKLFVLGLALLQAPTASAPAAGSSTPGPMMQAPTIATPGAQAAGASSPSPSGVAPAAEEPAPPPVVLPAFDGLADGLTELRFAVGEGQHDVAVGLADALLAPNAWSRARTAVEAEHAWLRRGFDAVEPGVAWLGLGGPTSKARAEIHYAAGVAEDRGGNAAAAQTRFQTALALAGPGSLRLDAGYNVGAIALGLAERLREAQKQAPAAGAQGAPSTQGSGLPGGEPLDRLESAYRAAKQELVLRLRADWHDEDTRANLELIQRRLREIEKQREEQKQQQQQQQQQKQDSKQDSKEQDPNQKDPEKSDAQQDPKDQKDQPSSSNEERKDPSEQKDPKEGEQKDAEQQDPTKSDQQSSEQQPDPKDAKDAQQAPAKPEERVMTREEILRLLSQLEEIEKEGQAVRARLQRSRRAGAEKDW